MQAQAPWAVALPRDVPILGWPVMTRFRTPRGRLLDRVDCFNGFLEWRWDVDQAIDHIEWRLWRCLEQLAPAVG